MENFTIEQILQKILPLISTKISLPAFNECNYCTAIPNFIGLYHYAGFVVINTICENHVPTLLKDKDMIVCLKLNESCIPIIANKIKLFKMLQ